MNKRFSINSILTIFLFGFSKIIQLASNLILTRILAPEAFGLMAIVNVIIIGLDMVSDFGIRTAIIQKKNADEIAFVRTAWTLQILRGIILFFIALIIAYPLSKVYGNPILFGLLMLAAFSPMFRGFQSIGFEYAYRKQELSRITFLELFSQFIAFVLTIVLAVHMQSVWALTLGALLQPLTRAVLSHIYLPGSIKLGVDKAHFSAIFKFGKWIFASTLLTYFAGKGIVALQGLFIDIQTLAYLSIASTFAWLVGDLVMKMSSQVFFPYLADTIRNNKDEFHKKLVQVRFLVLLASIPAFCFVSFIAYYLIDILYDERYLESGKYLVLLALNGAMALFVTPYPNAILAMGHSKTRFYLMLISASLKIIGLIIGFFTADVIGMIVGMGCGSFLSSFLIIAIARRYGMATPLIDAVFFLVLLALGSCSLWFNIGLFQ